MASVVSLSCFEWWQHDGSGGQVLATGGLVEDWQMFQNQNVLELVLDRG
jgi:hypothetical protein